ncbi:MAG: SCO family protein [Actinomycetia bacterium]|nr:SCO family protein [Actinomycetes bacterium]
MRARWRWWLLGVLAAANLYVWVVRPLVTPPAAPAAPGPAVTQGSSLGGRPAPDFTLVDQFGRRVTLSAFRGKTVVLAFVDSMCTTICPLTTQSMLDAMALLGPKAAAHVELLGVDANPDAISVADVRRYSLAHGLERRWLFLTGSLKELQAVWKAYGIYVAVEHGQIDHTPALYVISPAGREERVYLTSGQYGLLGPEAAALAAEVARFLPPDARPTNLQPAVVPPLVHRTTAVALPTLTARGLGAAVTVAADRPRLMVFWASWAPDAVAGLKALNAWAAAHPGFPPVYAVDVADTEPGLAAAERAARALGPRPAVRVVVDRTGQVADAYDVQDLPWIAWVDGKGRILWQHDGWAPPATVAARVAAR